MLSSLNTKLITNTPSLNKFQALSNNGQVSKQLQYNNLDTVSFSGAKVESSKNLEITQLKKSLQFFNGIGGFSQDGKEYVIVLEKGKTTPLPWSNIVSNDKCGFVSTESGGGFTYAHNSSFNRFTEWSNDTTSDKPGEVFYIRDNNSNKLWSPTGSPIRNKSTYVIRHGIGYTKFENEQNNIKSELLQYVAKDDPVKISKLTLENTSDKEKDLSISNYVEWVLGGSRKESSHGVITEKDAETGAIFVTNPADGFMRDPYKKHVAFIDFNNGNIDSLTGERKEFLGKYGKLDNPLGLNNPHKRLSGKLGAGLDPCTALQKSIKLAPGQKIELSCIMGQGENKEEARAFVSKYRKAGTLDSELQGVKAKWGDTLGKVQVNTPDKSMNIMLNGWLGYQNLSSRIQARTAFYQSGGALGYRDQLQDCMAFIVSNPQIAREQIIKASGRQFIEDKSVNHWWFPDLNWGARSHHRDDGTWLPLVAAKYIEETGDKGILDTETNYIESPDGKPLSLTGEEDTVTSKISDKKASIYQHCAEILNSRMEVGLNGLPLMGGGDWNDGMNEVGRGADGKGKGESVWMGMFQIEVFSKFAKIAEDRGDKEHAEKWNKHVDSLSKALDKSAWDGEWYKRAWFPDGTPLGSKVNKECKIDLLPQTWATWTLSNTPERRAKAEQAMDAIEKSFDGKPIFDKAGKLIRLFTPAFINSKPSPGYIQGYVAGTRENGGQYSHAATWTVKAYTELEKNKQGDKAYDGKTYTEKAYGDKAFEVFSMLNPINHARNKKEVNTYKTEPYVMAADVYGVDPHIGRGGWTWYTGSAGWMDRVGKESILGFNKIGDSLSINPCIPEKWDKYEMNYKHVGKDNNRENTTNYHITVENPEHVSSGVKEILVDEKPLTDDKKLIPLVEDKKEHEVKITLGKKLQQ
ncbi:MAG: hypothetical protein ACD_20C00056G0007 [uncultured bacterium]|nr:MAG: hypothetical protein ACD_20C00056G0007 [uncultured bacterium]